MGVSLNDNGVKKTKNDFVNEFHVGINFEHLFICFFRRCATYDLRIGDMVQR